MRKEGKQRAYRINCRPLYSAAWQGINFELKCNAMGWVGTGRNGPQFFDSQGEPFGQREELWAENRARRSPAFPWMTQNWGIGRLRQVGGCNNGRVRHQKPLSHPPGFMVHCQGQRTTRLCQLRKQSHLPSPSCLRYHYCRPRWFRC